MTNTYTKLFGSIIASTIWAEPAEITKVWVTLLALSDRNGEVQGTVPWLARQSYVSLEVCAAAVESFLGPDPHSRTKDHGGRRLEEIDGGWLLLNHAKYREMASAEHRRELDRERKRRQRERQKRQGA